MNPQHSVPSPARRPRRPRSQSARQPRRTAVPGRLPGVGVLVQTAASVPPPAPQPPAAPVPFESLGLHPALLVGVGERRFTRTTPIQTAVIPVARAGRDVIACAATGTGKTAAFVLPILDRLLAERAAAPDLPAGTRVLILTPTRELALQIDDDIQGFAYHTTLSSVVVCGGLPSDPQDRALRAGVDIVVATPGRLMDHLRSGAVDFHLLQVLVLDEADRMMDMGFWPDVSRIVAGLPATRQTLLFSATMPTDVQREARSIVREAVTIGHPDGNRPAATVTHTVETMPAPEKVEWLGRFLRRERGPVLVFARTKRGADRLASRLIAMGVRAAALHADRTQAQRLAAVEGLRSGRYTALVATDVAARGLDIHGITHVINFEVPDTREAYVHRTGRTGRAEATGTAVTLVAPGERRALEALARQVGLPLDTRPAAGA